MSLEVSKRRSEKPEVWIGTIGITPRPDHRPEDFPPDAVAAHVVILAWAEAALDYTNQIEQACDERGFDLYDVSDAMPFAEWIAEGFDKQEHLEETQHYMDLAQRVKESREVVFDSNFYYHDEYQSELEQLADAITDIGYWSWWAEEFPDTVRIEFGGVQLWSPLPEEGQPPRGVIALQFDEPHSVCFLTHKDAPADLDLNWPDLLHNDNFKLFDLRDPEDFRFNDGEAVLRIRDEARHIETRFGVSPHSEEFFDSGCGLAFWAGPIGCIIAAKEMTILNQSGEVALEQVPELHEQWWDYWGEYWKVRDTENAFPEDYACENTIPAGEMDDEDEAE